MSVTNQPPGSEPTKADDYHVMEHAGEFRRSAAYHAVSVLNVVLLIFVALLSFALFWVVARMVGMV